jgi:hypothetical protein
VVIDIPTTSEFHLFTDASLTGWGAILFGPSVVSIASHPRSSREQRYAKKGAGINFLELRSARRAIRQLIFESKNTAIHLWIDNTSALYTILRGRSNSFQLNKEMASMGRLLQRLGVHLLVHYVKSELNPADFWSRIDHTNGTNVL